MDFHIDPNASLAEIQLACFMAAITALVELAKTTDKDHIKLRALTEVARLCNPAKQPLPTPHGTPSASDGPPAPAAPHAPVPVARARGSEGQSATLPSAIDRGSARSMPNVPSADPHSPKPPSSPSTPSCSLPLNRRQRRRLARPEANERIYAAMCAASSNDSRGAV